MTACTEGMASSMALHLRPERDSDPARHRISRHCPCGPTVTLMGSRKTGFELIVQHKSDIPWSWGAVVRQE